MRTYVILLSISVHQHVQEWAGVSGSEREWAGVSENEREWAQIGTQVSTKIDRRMRKTKMSIEFWVMMPFHLPQVASCPYSAGGTYRLYGSRCHNPSGVCSVVLWSHASGSLVWDHGEIDGCKDKRYGSLHRLFPVWSCNHDTSAVWQAHFHLSFSLSLGDHWIFRHVLLLYQQVLRVITSCAIQVLHKCYAGATQVLRR